MRTGLGKLHIYSESIGIDICDGATVYVVLLAPREPVQFIIRILLHKKLALTGSKLIST